MMYCTHIYTYIVIPVFTRLIERKVEAPNVTNIFFMIKNCQEGMEISQKLGHIISEGGRGGVKSAPPRLLLSTLYTMDEYVF